MSYYSNQPFQSQHKQQTPTSRTGFGTVATGFEKRRVDSSLEGQQSQPQTFVTSRTDNNQFSSVNLNQPTNNATNINGKSLSNLALNNTNNQSNSNIFSAQDNGNSVSVAFNDINNQSAIGINDRRNNNNNRITSSHQLNNNNNKGLTSNDSIDHYTEDSSAANTAGESHSRVHYLTRLYFYVFLQMALASLLSYQSEISPGFNEWITAHSGLTFVFVLILTLVLALASFLYKSFLSRQFVNIGAYFLYTISLAILLVHLDATWSSNVHQMCQFMAFLTGALFLHMLLCVGPITFQNASLYVIGSVLIPLLRLEIYSILPPLTSYTLAVITALLGFYIVWENETIISGTTTQWSIEDPIVGSIGFFISLFTMLIRMSNLLAQNTIHSNTQK